MRVLAFGPGADQRQWGSLAKPRSWDARIVVLRSKTLSSWLALGGAMGFPWTLILVCSTGCADRDVVTAGDSSSTTASFGTNEDGTSAPADPGESTSDPMTPDTSGESGESEDVPPVVPELPGQSAEEAQFLDALRWDDGVFADLDGLELLEAARAIGRARGYVLCRCIYSPDQAPSGEEFDHITGCAIAESTFFQLEDDETLRCVTEDFATVPGLAEYLRCHASNTREQTRAKVSCEDPTEASGLDLPECERPPGIDGLFQNCGQSLYCQDGTRVVGGRCSGVSECPDDWDERGCFEEEGQDFIACGGVTFAPAQLCTIDEGCDDHGRMLCDLERYDVFLCADGAEIEIERACDRVDDCTDGSDESVCLR